MSGLLTQQTCSFHRAFRHAMRWTAVVRPALDGQRPVSSYPFLRFGNWGQNHAHYYPRLCDCFHGPHNDRWGGVGPFPFGRNNGSASVEILRNGNRNDIWRPCHGWPCAGLAPASRDKRSRLNQSGDFGAARWDARLILILAHHGRLDTSRRPKFEVPSLDLRQRMRYASTA